MMVNFIDAHRATWGGESICDVLPIAPATYHVHKARQADPTRLSARAVCDGRPKVEIRRVWKTAGSTYRCLGVDLRFDR